MNELKPCPFCGSEAELKTEYVAYGTPKAYVRCKHCEACTAFIYPRLDICANDEVIKLWNRRANDE